MDVINSFRLQFDGYVQWVLRGRPNEWQDFIGGLVRERGDLLLITILYLVFILFMWRWVLK